MNHAACLGSRGPFSTILPRPVAFPVPHDSTRRTALASVLTDASDIGMEDERREEGFLAALRLYERGRWQRAFEQLTELADDGNAPAAKLALLMLRYGSNLYGVAFQAQPTQVARWAQYVLGCSARVVRDQRVA